MEKVVYLLGAGFSAPLNLPVISDFYIKAKRMVESHNDEVFKKSFGVVEDKVRKISNIKHYFDSDQYNIEEILSILEMMDYLKEEKNAEHFRSYIAEVIKYYTPKIEDLRELNMSNFYDFIFTYNEKLRTYGFFVADILNLQLSKNKGDRKVFWFPIENPEFSYSIITLNYDLVIENFVRFLAGEGNNLFINEKEVNIEDLIDEKIAKLHGSVEPLKLVPPTWNKGSDEELLNEWKKAYKFLKEANHIRVLGYSLPNSDSYIKYLLKAAILECENLQSIDVICLDKGGTVKERYDDFVKFNFYKFKNVDILNYLLINFKLHREEFSKIVNEPNKSYFVLDFKYLENAHSDFMN